MQKNDRIELTIDSVTNEGSGVGRYEGMAVFVPETAPGDRIAAHVVKVLPRYAYARVERLIEASPQRCAQDCPVGQRCGGCSLRHLSYGAEKQLKRQWVQDAFDRIGGFGLTVGALVSTEVVDGYRNKAMYPVREKDGVVQLGFFAKRTHEVVAQTDCRLQPPEFSRIAQAVLEFLSGHKISCYDERTGKGLVRHLYLRKAFATGEIMVCLVLNGESLPGARELIAKLGELQLPIASVCVNINRENTNVILGRRTKVLSGNDAITDVLCGVRVRLSAQSFYQVNREAAQLLYAEAARCAALTGKETLLDLYCGTGTIGLSMARDAGELIGVEVVAPAVEDARRNAHENGIANARFLCADAAQAANQLAEEGVQPDVVVVDPPRKGCEGDVLDSIARMAPRRVVMVSCNPSTAARDARRLEELGYALESVVPFDLFPRTCHVECVVLMSNE